MPYYNEDMFILYLSMLQDILFVHTSKILHTILLCPPHLTNLIHHPIVKPITINILNIDVFEMTNQVIVN